MVASHHFTRTDTFGLKEQIFQRIGRQRAEMYFHELNRFLNLKLSKIDFNRCLVQTLGKENIYLHNKLIQAILQNAQHSKVPPQKACKTNGLGIRTSNNVQNKDSSMPKRKFRTERPSPLGPLGKSSSTYEDTGLRINESPTELQSLSSRPPVVEEGEEVEQFFGGSNVRRWSGITTPLGVSLNEARKASGFRYGVVEQCCQQSGMLPDTISLRDRMQKKFAPEGFGISLDSCRVLNSGLDVYLKKLIEPCVGSVRSRGISGRQNIQMMQGPFTSQMMQGPFTGQMMQGPYTSQMMQGPFTSQVMHGPFTRRPAQPTHISMRDFQVAVESNPRVLGENWPVQFEKICYFAR